MSNFINLLVFLDEEFLPRFIKDYLLPYLFFKLNIKTMITKIFNSEN